jgi:hypothetical protein
MITKRIERVMMDRYGKTTCPQALRNVPKTCSLRSREIAAAEPGRNNTAPSGWVLEPALTHHSMRGSATIGRAIERSDHYLVVHLITVFCLVHFINIEGQILIEVRSNTPGGRVVHSSPMKDISDT